TSQLAPRAEKWLPKGRRRIPRIKNLRIKTGVLKRLIKEKAMYETEVVDQEAKIVKLKAEGQDEHVIKKQGEVLLESQNMVPDCRRRIQKAYSDLKSLMGEDWTGFTDSEQYKAAREILDNNKDLDDTETSFTE
ncbi:Tubulin-specific chaperone A, partial [Geodia barretti]